VAGRINSWDWSRDNAQLWDVTVWDLDNKIKGGRMKKTLYFLIGLCVISMIMVSVAIACDPPTPNCPSTQTQSQIQSQDQQQKQFQSIKNSNTNINKNVIKNTISPVNTNTNTFSPTISVTVPESSPVPVESEPRSLTVNAATSVEVPVDPKPIDASSFRQFNSIPDNPIPAAPLYNGPTNERAWNILSNLNLLPSRITLEEAENMSVPKEIVYNEIIGYLTLIKKSDYGDGSCSLVEKVDREKVVGVIFIPKVPNTVSGLGFAMKTAILDAYANQLYFAGSAIDYVPKGYTIGFGGGGAASQLAGDRMSTSYSGQGTFLFSYSKGGLEKTQGLIFVLMRE